MLRRHSLGDLVPFGSPLLALIDQARARGAAVNEYKVDLSTPRNPGERLVDLHVAPLPERPDNVVVMLQERTIADKMDRQLTHRGAARSVTALAAMLAHEIKNPLSGIRGAAQLLESRRQRRRPHAHAADLRRGRPDREARRPHGGVHRRAADRARAGQHPCRARSREAARAFRLCAQHQVRRGVRPVAAAGARQSRPADPAVPQPREERRRSDRRGRHRRRDPAHHRVPSRRAPGAAGQQDAGVAAAGILRQGQRAGRARGSAAASVRSVRDDQADGLRSRASRWCRRSSAITAASSNASRNRDRRSFAYSCPCIGTTSPSRAALPKGDADACRKYSGGRRRCGDPHRLEPGAVARRLRGPLDQQCRDAVALDQPGRRRPRHHRRRDAGRERLRPAAAHQEAAARSAGADHERAEHVHDRDPRVGAGRLRVSAEAVRSQGTDRDRRPRALGAEGARRRPPPSRRISTPSRWSAARRRCRKSTGCWRA